MSRAINIDVSADFVEELASRHKLTISTIESLSSGGTRVVMMNSQDAARARELMKSKIIQGKVVRSPLHMARKPLPWSRS
jgi:hypothetical protein